MMENERGSFYDEKNGISNIRILSFFEWFFSNRTMLSKIQQSSAIRYTRSSCLNCKEVQFDRQEDFLKMYILFFSRRVYRRNAMYNEKWARKEGKCS